MTYLDFRKSILATKPDVPLTAFSHNDLDELRAQIMRICLPTALHCRIGLYDITKRELAGALAHGDQNYDAIRNYHENPLAPYALTGPQVEDHYLHTIQKLVDVTLWVCEVMGPHPFRLVELQLRDLLFRPQPGMAHAYLPPMTFPPDQAVSEDQRIWLTYGWLIKRLETESPQWEARMLTAQGLHQRLIHQLAEVLLPEGASLAVAGFEARFGATREHGEWSPDGFLIWSFRFLPEHYHTIAELAARVIDLCRRYTDKSLDDRISSEAYNQIRHILCPFVMLNPIGDPKNHAQAVDSDQA